MELFVTGQYGVDIERLAGQVLARNGVAVPPVNIDELAQAEGLNFDVRDFESVHGAYYREPDGRGRAVISSKQGRDRPLDARAIRRCAAHATLLGRRADAGEGVAV